MLARMRASDETADGRFLTGVTSTGIYCLPSCPARTPKPENVVFFATEADAVAFGLRPCKRCRPDRFYANEDPQRNRFDAALHSLRTRPADVPDVAALAACVGVSPSQLYTLAGRYAGTSPGELIHESRIEAAKRLLGSGRLGATEAAYAVGYASVSAFYARFKRATGSTPAAFARHAFEARDSA